MVLLIMLLTLLLAPVLLLLGGERDSVTRRILSSLVLFTASLPPRSY